MAGSPGSIKSVPARIFIGGATVALFVWLFFRIPGRIDWLRGWAYLGLLTFGQGLSSLYVWRKDPEVLRRRGKIGQGTRTWDKVVLGLFGTAYIAVIIVAGLDERYAWSTMSGWLWPLGAALYVFCVFILTWSMSVNTHFEKTVRIQHDREHRVIDSGPYRIVRHPGYLGTIFGFALAAPLLLGSWWAFIPAAIAVASLVLRTALEDRTLKKELDGYEAYTQNVRYRLLPGLW
ncbi:MAG TPA: isoprenylcysteine carboxylmethyltransferase family protein [Phycisphaerales bacterium]|nr:isoprenylcysteine carboxylmethyltransferase family protein [Phycisphaerales bacterium]